MQELRNQVSTLRGKTADNKKVVDKAHATAKRMEELEKSAKQIDAMNATIHELRQESASKAALVTRLRQDADAAEKVHATRTAVIGTMEAEQARLKVHVTHSFVDSLTH